MRINAALKLAPFVRSGKTVPLSRLTDLLTSRASAPAVDRWLALRIRQSLVLLDGDLARAARHLDLSVTTAVAILTRDNAALDVETDAAEAHAALLEPTLNLREAERNFRYHYVVGAVTQTMGDLTAAARRIGVDRGTIYRVLRNVKP